MMVIDFLNINLIDRYILYTFSIVKFNMVFFIHFYFRIRKYFLNKHKKRRFLSKSKKYLQSFIITGKALLSSNFCLQFSYSYFKIVQSELSIYLIPCLIGWFFEYEYEYKIFFLSIHTKIMSQYS